MTIRISLFSTKHFVWTLLVLAIFPPPTTQFSEDTVKFAVSEDAPLNTIIGRLDPILGYSYRLSRGNSKIRFDDQSLEFSTSAPLDRESEDSIDMLIITSPPSIIHVLIDILDVNDNSPTFPVDVQKLEIPETAPIGFRLQIHGATDPDQSQNGTIGKYELEEETITVGTKDKTTPFRIVESDGFVFLEVIGKLDREERELYAMRLTAQDDGVPKLSSSCLLNIIILDINDNPPDFKIRSLSLKWDGNPSYSKLFHLNATDMDSGENGQLTYRILPTAGSSYTYFGINEDNILVTQNNTSCDPRCEITVEARDSGSPSLATTLDIDVMVEYGNEHEPNINIRFYPSDYPFIIVQPEDVNGKTLAILSITDSDGPLGRNSTIWIENGNEKSIFSLISRQSINILTLKNVEAAENDEYNLEFVANDGQSPIERISRKTLKIYFKKFIKSLEVHVEKEMNVNVEADTVAGSFVAHVIAQNCSEMCTFELMNSDVFRIDRMNGIIVTSSPLPNDVTSYHLPIRIHPPPPSTRSLETDVFVKVIRDSAPKNLIRSSKDTPVHLQKAYTFSTWQNVTVGTVVGRLPKGQVYSTVDTESELGVFPDGSIFLGKSIGAKDLMTLPVILENSNTTQTSLVTLLIKPLNLHSPTCQTSDFHVSEDTPRGKIVGKLHAIDKDSGVNGVVYYRILEDLEGRFHVDSISGSLRLLRELDAENQSNLTIQYEVRDYGTPSRSTNCSVIIHIDDVNDNPPKFGSSYYSAKISGKPNETVAIIHAEDKDVTSRNSRIQYRILNFQNHFHMDKETGKVMTWQKIPRTFGRINITVEAVNIDSENLLATQTFLLVTVPLSDTVEVNVNGFDTQNSIKVFKNDKIGEHLFKIDLEATDTVVYSTVDPRFHVDQRGNIILAHEPSLRPPEPLRITLSSLSGRKLKNLEIQVEHVDADERNEPVESVEEVILDLNSTRILEFSKNWRIGKVILESSEPRVTVPFWIQDRILYRNENVTIDAFLVLESEDDDGSINYKILHILTSNPSGSTPSKPKCSSTVHLITPPSTVPLPCDHVILQSQSSKLQIHENTLLIPTQSELIQHVDLISAGRDPFMMTLIRDEQSDEVKFATSNVLMLLSSVHSIGTSFGRVTAESGYRIRYFLVGTDKISIDPDTGELVLRKRFYRNLNDIQIVAVIPKGVAKAKITIEVIEDRLSLTRSSFFLIAPPTSSDSPIGSISIERDDVIIDVIDDRFYNRNMEIFAKKNFSPIETFYDIPGIVKKGKLSAPINITVFFGGSMDQRNRKENELMFQVEENSPIGTIVGQVPNASISKYRLIDANCGVTIDENGIIRTTKPFDHETISLLRTKMIEPLENRIWDLLIFIGDVNDNPPRILNAPGRITVGSNLHYKLQYSDADDFATNPFFDIIDGDFNGNLQIDNTGVIRINSKPKESFNATIRMYDNRPPYPVHFDDVTIEFHVAKEEEKDVECRNVDFWIPTKEEMKMKANMPVTWRLVSRNATINPFTGVIQMRSNANLSSGSFDLQIQAISYSGNHSGYCTCRIHILEDQEEPVTLEFQNSTYEFWVSETMDRNSEIGKIEIQNLSNGLPRVTYRILDDFNFTISHFDGTILTNTPLDFESRRTFEFDVSAAAAAATTSSSSFCTARVIIHVIDENDEAPRFITGDVVNLKVQEELTAVPYPLIIGSSIAEDLDEGQNGVVTYSILSGNTTMFAVNSTSGDILSLSPLDREESPIYELLIEAKDAGIPSLSATSRVVIHVEDINDNTPQFDLPGYYVRIPENLAPGAKILRLHAEDLDEGARLLYFLECTVCPFKIDVATGWITVAGKLDREENSEWRITVEVTDGDRNSSVTVEIEVEDVNDNAPRILNQNLDIYVKEDSPTVIHVVDVQDADYKDTLKFYLNDTSFKISDQGEILSTSESKYPSSIRVTVTDETGHVANSEYRFYTHNKKGFPVFTEKLEIVSAKEHLEQELAVFKAKGQGVRYSIAGRCKEHFEINGVSGVLKAKPTLDREQFSECPTFIIATSFIDNKPLTAITKILIKIVDINDNAPRFDHQIYNFNVTENSGATLIGHVTARDKDSNSRIFYEIVGGDPEKEFIITENGQIGSIRDLDRETRSEYRLILEAFDDGKPRRRGNTTVIIKVLDEDDNAPRFSRIFHVEVREDVEIGDEVILLSASDSDEKSNHRFEFENTGDERIPFRIEETTGMVYVNDSLDFEKKPSYRIKVRLTDGAWLIETSLFVNVKDVNDNAPIFEQQEYFFVVNETNSPNSTIGSIHATDLDSLENGRIRYSISSPYFRIHPDSGVITKLRPLSEDVMTIQVKAMDHGIPRLESTVEVHVAIQEAVEIRRIRREAKIGDVVGNDVEKDARIFPLDVATVTKSREVVLKTSNAGFWILESSRILKFEISENLDIPVSTHRVNLTLTGSELLGTVIHQIHVPGCLEYLDSNHQNFKISRNGEVRITGFPVTSTVIEFKCHDGLWPISQNSTVITMDILVMDPPKTLLTTRPNTLRPYKSLPKTIDIHLSAESPIGTVLWENNVPVSMETSDLVNLTRGNLVLKEKIRKSQFEVFDTEFKRTTITILPEPEAPACPTFPKEFYFVEKSNPRHPDIQSFEWTEEEMHGCQMVVENETHLFYANGSTVISLKPLAPGTYQFSLILQSLQSTRSRCHVTVTVPPVPADQVDAPTVVYLGEDLPKGFKLRNRWELEGPKPIRILRDDVDHLEHVEDVHLGGVDQNLEFHAATVILYTSKSGIRHLIQDLRLTYSDMKIHHLATWQVTQDVKYQVTVAMVDRNGVVLEREETLNTLDAFFKKRPDIGFIGFESNACDGVTCVPVESRCRSVLSEGSRLSPRCYCGSEPCSEEPSPTRTPTILKSPLLTCSDLSCGSLGSCFMDPLPVCRCSDGFESNYPCDKAQEVFSTPGNVEITLKNSTVIPNCKNCSGLQKMELDFRTNSLENRELMRVDFGKQQAVVEILSSSIQFSISDEFHRPIQTRIDKPIADGKWHRLLLQMGDDGKKISIQIDGRGKEVKSRVALPMLFDSKRIQISGGNSELCLRRILVQNQFLHPELSSNTYFHVTPTSTVSNTCHVPRPSSGRTTLQNTTTVILLLILAIITLIALSLCILAIRRRWIRAQKSKESSSSSSGWKKATEIDAFAVPRVKGHVNRSMVKSPDDTYDVAMGASQMKSTSTDDMTHHIYTSSSSRRYQPQVPPYRRDGHINMAYL